MFIDRDGALFGLILHFLRNGELPLTSRADLLLLRTDADFYGIEPLKAAVERLLAA